MNALSLFFCFGTKNDVQKGYAKTDNKSTESLLSTLFDTLFPTW